MLPLAKDSQVVRVDDREVELTNLDKYLWPEDGITKADYIHAVFMLSHLLLPQLRDRPLTVTRYPDGIDGDWFYQKDCPEHAPDWIPTYPVTSPGGDKVTRYILAQEPATLVWLANQAAIEFHPWMSRVQSPDFPDYAVIDLDPSEGASFDDVRLVAKAVRHVLDHLGLVGYPKLSGATGIHIYVPLVPKYTYDVTRQLAGYVGKVIAAALPDKATNERLVKKRGPRVYIDHLQNLPGKTIVAAYSARPKRGAPVSVPFDWDELDTVDPLHFTLKDLDQLLQRPPHLDDMERRRQNIDALLPLIRGEIGTDPR